VNHETLKNERESLERIHTFSLKEPIDFNLTYDPQKNLAQKFGVPGDENGNLNVSTGSALATLNRVRNSSADSRDSSTGSNRSCSRYVPEKVAIFEKQVKHTYTIVKELISI